MNRRIILGAAGLLLSLGLTAALAESAPSSQASAQPLPAAGAVREPIFDGLGNLHHPVTTNSPLAQRFFDQGLTFVYAFNHDEATGSFREAARLDPKNAYYNYALGAVAVQSRTPGDAIPYFQEYIAHKPEDPRGRFALGAAYFYSANYDAARKELQRITDVNRSAAGYENFQQWLAGTQLEQSLALEDYSVSNRGLRSGLIGTAEQIVERVAAFEAAGVDLLLLQCSPQYEEMERFAETVIRPLCSAVCAH